jgi:hypothetical protein
LSVVDSAVACMRGSQVKTSEFVSSARDARVEKRLSPWRSRGVAQRSERRRPRQRSPALIRRQHSDPQF